MKRVILVLLCATVVASAADAGGAWKLSYTTRNGLRREPKLELKMEGDSLAGTLSGDSGSAPISNGKVSGDEVAFDLVRDARYDLITVHFKGRIEGDTMTLTMQYGNRGPVTITGKKSQ